MIKGLVEMKKLADISAFERLGASGGVSDVSVFNFQVSVDIDNWDAWREFMKYAGPDQWTTMGFDKVDLLPKEAQKECFDNLEELYLAADGGSWIVPLIYYDDVITQLIAALDEEYNEDTPVG